LLTQSRVTKTSHIAEQLHINWGSSRKVIDNCEVTTKYAQRLESPTHEGYCSLIMKEAGKPLQPTELEI